MRATVPSTKPKHLRRGAPFQTTTSAYLYKYGGCNKIKFHESSLWWWRWSIKLSISLNIKQSSVGFCPYNGTMPLKLHGKERLFKSVHKSTIWSHLLLWWQTVHSDSCHQTLGVIKLFKVNSSKLPEISLFVGLLVMQTLYINNVLSIFIEQYFNDTLKNDCMLLTYHARISEWIYTLYVPECQGNPYSKQARYLKFKWQQRDSNV